MKQKRQTEGKKMAPLKVEQYVVGPVQTNCYFAVNDETKEMILIDPGANADRLIQIIEEEKLNPVAILLTHGHFDHAGGRCGSRSAFLVSRSMPRSMRERPSMIQS